MTTGNSSYQNPTSESIEDTKQQVCSKTKKLTPSADVIELNTVPKSKGKVTSELESSLGAIATNQAKTKPAYKPRKTTKKDTNLESLVLANQEKQNTSAHDLIDNTPDEPALSPLVQMIIKAIQENKAIELCFNEPDINPTRTFEPRQLTFDTFAKDWYVWGWDRRYNTERHHLLSLIARVNLIDGIGRLAQSCCLENVPANCIGGWLGGEVIPVRVILLKQWVFAVRQAPAPFPEFKIEDLEDGKAQATFVATDLRVVARWVMQFGDGVQVLEPQRLTDRIRQVGLIWSNKLVANNTIRTYTPRQEQRFENKTENKVDYKVDATTERKTIEQFKQYNNRDASDNIRPTKIEIRIDRL